MNEYVNNDIGSFFLLSLSGHMESTSQHYKFQGFLTFGTEVGSCSFTPHCKQWNDFISHMWRIFFRLLRHRNHPIVTHMYTGRGANMNWFVFSQGSTSHVIYKADLPAVAEKNTWFNFSRTQTHLDYAKCPKYYTWSIYCNLYWIHILCGFRCFGKMLSSAAAYPI